MAAPAGVGSGSAPEPVTPEPGATQPVALEPVTLELAATEPAATEPIALEPVMTEPLALEAAVPRCARSARPAGRSAARSATPHEVKNSTRTGASAAGLTSCV